jgi:hypothetical protein
MRDYLHQKKGSEGKATAIRRKTMALAARWGLLLLIVVVVIGILVVPLTAAMNNESSPQLVTGTGTLTDVDLTNWTGVVTTDLGIPVFFQVTKPYLLETLFVGARVTVEIDQEGRGNKIIDASKVEFLSPSTEELTILPSVQPLRGPLIGLVREQDTRWMPMPGFTAGGLVS